MALLCLGFSGTFETKTRVLTEISTTDQSCPGSLVEAGMLLKLSPPHPKGPRDLEA
jgi:hypothetical protein